MSLSSLLLKTTGKVAPVDKGLDDIFKSTATHPPEPLVPSSSKRHPNSEVANKKRKEIEGKHVSVPAKRSKREEPNEDPKPRKPERKKEKKSGKRKDSQDDTFETPQALEAKSLPGSPSKAPDADPDAESSQSNSEDDVDPSSLVHESLLKGASSKVKAKKAPQKKYVPQDETPEQRNARTIFVGNVSVEVAKSRPLVKQLKRHILSFVPTAKIESVRLRSVAFQNPTSQLPSSKPSTKPDEKGKEKEGRQHDRDRISSWREQQVKNSRRGEDDEDDLTSASNTNNGKTYLTSAEKKRVAFIKHEFHSAVDSMNAYIVFAHPTPSDILMKTRSANLPPPSLVMDPYEAARVAAQKGDETLFLERTIRIDIVGSNTHAGLGAGKGNEKSGGGSHVVGDPKLTVFVGSLDFASKEEDLRVFFEGLVSAERGPPPLMVEDEDGEDGTDGEEDDVSALSKKKGSWVRRVRIIRDKDTLLGKGFAYVQFADRECVDEILSMEQDRLKFAKRKLRVQRCKTLPGGSHKVHLHVQAPGTSSKPSLPKPTRKTPTQATPNRPLPKGDPNLGTKISHLSKEERKQVKASDADRIARRLAKKSMAKSKMSLVEQGVKGGQGERIRKRGGSDKRDSGGAKGKGPGRVRSQKALSKLNAKK